jgi:hypothetical protein
MIDHDHIRWIESRNLIMDHIERLRVYEARSLIRDLEAAATIPPRARDVLQEMREYTNKVETFRAELLSAARKPSSGVVISHEKHGQLTLVTVNDERLEFRNIYGAPVQLRPDEFSSGQIIQLSSLLSSAGNRLPSTGDYQQFLARRQQILSGPFPGANFRPANPDGMQQVRPRVPQFGSGQRRPKPGQFSGLPNSLQGAQR